jgi:Zn-dependent peptidase ImmA (M78 family)
MSADLAYINSDVLIWARKFRNLSHEQLASSQLKAEQIKAWEDNRGLPTHAQAEALAKKLKLPLVVLFLSSHPQMTALIPDLRTVSGGPVQNPSAEFFEVINSAYVKQDWYRSFEISRGAKPLPFVGKFRMRDSFAVIAGDLRDTLGISDNLRRRVSSWREFLEQLIVAAESLGVLVFRSAIVGHDTKRKLAVKEFRGFVLTDPFAPIIFINDEDAKAAQTFTLVHELAHIWIGQSGISDPDIKKKPAAFQNAVERFCNRVAAEVLVPEKDFLTRWDSHLSLTQNINRLTAHYRVSSLVVLIQAHDLGKIRDDEFSAKFDAELQRFRRQDQKDKTAEEKSARKPGGNFWASFVIRNSKSFTDLVVRSAREGKSRYTEAASLLGLRAPSFERYLERLDALR